MHMKIDGPPAANRLSPRSALLLGAGVIALLAGISIFFIRGQPTPKPYSVPQSSASAALGESGARGYAIVSPTSPNCGVTSDGGDSCSEAYHYEYNIAVTPIPDGRTITTIKTNADGTFVATLPPGRYQFQAQGRMVSKPQYVTIDKGHYTDVVIQFDAGIR